MSYAKYLLFYGDLHGHSNLSSCGKCPGRNVFEKDCYIHTSVIEEYSKSISTEETIDLFYDYAKNKLNLDFAVLTDHDFQLSDEQWRLVQRKASEWYLPGRFVTFSGYEWTSYAYGHRNVYYLTDDKPIFRCVDYGSSPYLEKGRSPRELWGFLRKVGAKAITIPHHPSLTQFPVDWSYHDPYFERLVEIASIWGVFEYYGNPYTCINSDNLPRYFVQDALNMGYRLGIVGGGDSHDCVPGGDFRPIIVKNFRGGRLNPLSQIHVNYFIYNPFGCGLTAVYAKKLTREAVFNALYKRRVYALLGTRIKLEFRVDDLLMGEEKTVEEGHKPIIRVRVEGDDVIDRVEIIRDGQVVYRKFGKGKILAFKWIDENPPPRKLHYYYVRVIQRNGGRAWSSPIWLKYSIKDKFKINGNVLESFENNVVVLKFRDKPVPKHKVPERLEKAKNGTFLWLEQENSELVLKIRFKSTDRPIVFRGSLKLYGIPYYEVYPLNFATMKYGGDLFTDNYKGLIEWYVMVSANLTPQDTSRIKGLNIRLRINPLEKAWVEAEAYQDDKPATIYIGSHKTKEYLKLILYDPDKAFYRRILNKDEKVVLSKGEYTVIYPVIDNKGLKSLILTG